MKMIHYIYLSACFQLALIPKSPKKQTNKQTEQTKRKSSQLTGQLVSGLQPAHHTLLHLLQPRHGIVRLVDVSLTVGRS